jgi:hypothetical protein
MAPGSPSARRSVRSIDVACLAADVERLGADPRRDRQDAVGRHDAFPPQVPDVKGYLWLMPTHRPHASDFAIRGAVLQVVFG